MHDDLTIYERIASNRKTTKVLAEYDLPINNERLLIQRLLGCAGWAPFHRVCSSEHRVSESEINDQLAGVEPWRFYILDSAECRRLRPMTQSMEAAGKIPSMLASAMATIVATWLPNPPSWSMEDSADRFQMASPDTRSMEHSPKTGDSEYFEPTVDNVEHIAAASAAIQSLLLAASAAGLKNYWSSGGVFRSQAVRQLLGIPASQRVLGVIFLFPTILPETTDIRVVGSKLRPSRGSAPAWSRWVNLGCSVPDGNLEPQ